MDISKYIYSECQSPVKVKVYNGITNVYEEKEVPCGKCYHCKITRINEWVTRMVIQSNYSKYVYFGTLTYGSKQPHEYNNENLSYWTDFNKEKHLVLTPLVLRKDHVQKFLKRLRKNTGVKFQVAYCGEYGSMYNRPHYHYIIWSNQPISKLQVYKAWSVLSLDHKKRYVLGRIEHRDIKNNSYPIAGDVDNTMVFKYVCKYVQKFDFKFEDLKTIKEHRITFIKLFDYGKVECKNSKKIDYLHDEFDSWIKEKQIKTWDDYKKVFCPFFHCSKKPAIGYQYLQDNLHEFQKCNFKLFGLQGDYIFPLYFIRKTKESICPLMAESETDSSKTSYSRLPKMAALLDNIMVVQQIAEDTEQIVNLFQSDNYHYTLQTQERIIDGEYLYDDRDTQQCRNVHNRYTKAYFGFYDVAKKVRYSFRGSYYAMYNTSTDSYIGKCSLEDAKNIITYYYEKLKHAILLPLLAKSKISADKKNALINDLGGEDKFREVKKRCVEQLNRNVSRRQSIYKQTKTFE